MCQALRFVHSECMCGRERERKRESSRCHGKIEPSFCYRDLWFSVTSLDGILPKNEQTREKDGRRREGQASVDPSLPVPHSLVQGLGLNNDTARVR
jgi:hypothetical protein